MNQSAASAQDWEFHTDLPVGEILRRTRVHYGQNLADISRILRIRASQLEAIEQGNIEELPGRVYAIGFVRSYSEYLGLDGDQMVRIFKTQSVGGRAKPALNFPVAAKDSQLPNFYIIAGSITGAILLMVVWAMMHGPSDMVREIPAVPDNLKAEILDGQREKPVVITAEEGAPPPSPESLNQVAPAAGTQAATGAIPPVMLEIIENTWVEIKTEDGSTILRQVLKAGDRYVVPDQEGLVLSTGNAGGLKILVNGQPIAPIGKSSQVLRDLPLDPEKLIEKH